jgi:cobyrinic acid a,c-diamide synthase
MTKEIVGMMQDAFAKVGVQLLGMVPRLNLEQRGMIPEVEIRYEDFCSQAIDAVEKNLNLDLIVDVAAPPKLTAVDYDALTEQFKKLLTNYSLNASKGGDQQGC